MDFLRSLPIFVDTPSVLFVHAGIDPMLPIDAQSDEDLVFIRHRFFESRRPLPKLIVHGHTPNEEPEVLPKRLNLDTGAFHSGKLTVARLWKGACISSRHDQAPAFAGSRFFGVSSV